MRSLFRTVGLGLMALAGWGMVNPGPAAAAEFVLRVEHFLPAPSNAQTKLIKPWADRIEKQSGGRIEVQIYPSMQLGGKPPQLYDQVRDGVADAVWTVLGYTPGRFPMSEVFELPFVTGTAEATTQAEWEFYQKHMKSEFKDVHVLLIHSHAPGLFHMRDKPVMNLEDLKGLKIRAPTRTSNETLKLLGATPVGMPIPAVPEALQRGVVDGALLPFEVAGALKIDQLVKYDTEVGGDRGLYTAVFLFAMNKQKYESLPADLKKIIDDNSGGNIAKQIGAAWDKAEEPGRKIAQAHGNKFNTIQGAELARWKKVTRPVIDHWIESMNQKGFDGRALYNDAVALVAKYSK